MEVTDGQQLIEEPIFSHFGFSSDALPMLLISLGVSTLILVVLVIISTRNKHRERRAILKTAEDVHAIRELLEKRQPAIPPRKIYPTVEVKQPEELKNDPQVPAQP